LVTMELKTGAIFTWKTGSLNNMFELGEY